MRTKRYRRGRGPDAPVEHSSCATYRACRLFDTPSASRRRSAIPPKSTVFTGCGPRRHHDAGVVPGKLSDSRLRPARARPGPVSPTTRRARSRRSTSRPGGSRPAAQGDRRRYTVYGHDLTVRTNHIDMDHAFLHGPGTFLYPVNQRNAAIEVELTFPESGRWSRPRSRSARSRRPRTRASAAPAAASAASIDELYDHPIHLGRVRTFNVRAQVPVKLACGASARAAACSTRAGSRRTRRDRRRSHQAVRRGAVHRLHVHPDAHARGLRRPPSIARRA